MKRTIAESQTIVGRSPEMKKVFNMISQVGPVDVPVLLCGESGTGKELVAAAIHRISTRRAGPLVAVNAGALTTSLISSELFGHVKGAYTGASDHSAGKISAAENGTLFLDEVTAMDEKAQVSLLRFLETREYRPVGSSRSVRAHVRVIAATNEDLSERIESGAFREDLYFRLGAFRIGLPPLRERGDDVVLLARRFIRFYSGELLGREAAPSLSPDAVRRLLDHDWPGNVRELQNVIIRTLIMCEGSTITGADLVIDEDPPEEETFELHVGSTLDEVEKLVISRTLQMAGGNKTLASKILGISRKAVYNKLRAHHLS